MARKIRDPRSRERIVEAGWRAVADLGVRGATVRAIAAEAGVSTGYVMHYFADKQQIAEAVLDYNNIRAGNRVMTARDGRRGLAALTAAVEALMPLDDARRLEWQVWVAFWNEARRNEDAAAGLGGGRRVLGQLLATSLTEAVADGDLPDGLDISYEAERLVTLAAGLGLLAGVGRRANVKPFAARLLADHLAAIGTAGAAVPRRPGGSLRP